MNPISLIILVIAQLLHPPAASCPKGTGWFVDGVHPSGEFRCLHVAVVESDDPADLEIAGQIFCTDPRVPIVVDYRTVACQVRH